jgi:nicotinamide-nucleotide amidase
MDNDKNNLVPLTEYLKANHLLLSTAESCTAGQMIALLAGIPGSGELLESGYVVYSPEAKQRILHVSGRTIDAYGLTSEEVAIEMALGALKGGPANVAVSTTGVAGPDPMDGIQPGTVCIAWVFSKDSDVATYAQTRLFEGDRIQVQMDASLYALNQIPAFHRETLSS